MRILNLKRVRNPRHWAIGAAAAALILATTAGSPLQADEVPGAPGDGSAWTTGGKQGVGTSHTLESKVWFTLGEGILHEVYFPQADIPNVQDFQFIVSDGSTFVDLERDATEHKVELPDPRALTYRQINTANSGNYQLTKTYVTDPKRSTLLIETRFHALKGGPYQLYVLYNPSLGGSGKCDRGKTDGKALVASDRADLGACDPNGFLGKLVVASALVASPAFTKTSNGYSGKTNDGKSSDGLVDLKADNRLDNLFAEVSSPGNLVQIGEISVGNDTTFRLALGFGSATAGQPGTPTLDDAQAAARADALANANGSLATPFAQQRSSYQDGWHSYLASLKPPPNSVAGDPKLTQQYNVAVMILAAHEDKSFRGANVASLTTPWGNFVETDKADNYKEAGYHHVWGRDLYQVATALLAAGDADAAKRSLNYLLDKQQIKAPADGLEVGAFPRFSRLDGVTDRGCCEQFDQDAFPLVLASQLGQTETETWDKLKLSADHIRDKGPATPAERWEEMSDLSPSTIAAEIAGLVCAHDIAQKNGDPDAQSYLDKAKDWQRHIEKWTFTTNGTFGDRRYYERIDHDGDPNDEFQREFVKPTCDEGQLPNCQCPGDKPCKEKFWEKDVVDAGFLELVRLGVKPPNDPWVLQSLAEVDQIIRVRTPNGDMYHRYNHDSYGENASSGAGWGNHNGDTGRLWPILTGERGEYELANARSATSFLVTMAQSANEGFMIPEQAWDRADQFNFVFGEGTGSATPLAWSMAEFIRLAHSIDAGKPVETPQVVADLFGRPPVGTGNVIFTVTVPASTDGTGKYVFIAGELDKLDPALPVWQPFGVEMARIDPTHWQIGLPGKRGAKAQYKYVLQDWPFVERNASCQEANNRSITVSFDSTGVQNVNDAVPNWRNVAPCGS